MGQSDTDPMAMTPPFSTEESGASAERTDEQTLVVPTEVDDIASTEPMSGSPAPSSSSHASSADGDASLLGGLRRQRPPPKLTPQIRAASEGGEAVAYYAGPQALPTRFDTPPLEPGVELASTPGAPETVPIRVAAPASPHARRREGADTVRRPPQAARSSGRSALLAIALVTLVGGAVAVWFAATPGRQLGEHRPTGPQAAPVSVAPPTPQPSASTVASAKIVDDDATPSAARPIPHPRSMPTAAPTLTSRSGGPSSPSIRSAEPRPSPLAPSSTQTSEPRNLPPPLPTAKTDHDRSI